MLKLLLAAVEPHSHPISAWQLGLVAVQVLIALITIGVNIWYYRGIAQRGQQALDTQKADYRLKLTQQTGPIGERIRIACQNAVTVSLAGTKPKKEASGQSGNLRDVLRELEELPQSIRGLNNETELSQAIDGLEAAIRRYLESEKSDDPHIERVVVCGLIDTAATKLKSEWEDGDKARITKLLPEQPKKRNK